MFSRWMLPYEPVRTALSRRRWLVVGLLAAGALAYLAFHPWAAVSATGVVALIALGTWLCHLRLDRRARARTGEDIGSFARAFDRRAPMFDPWVVRAVWDGLAPWTTLRKGRRFALRPSDVIADIGCLGGDLDDVFVEAATRARRRIDLTETNPYYDRVKTAGDLVAFIAHQPHVTTI